PAAAVHALSSSPADLGRRQSAPTGRATCTTDAGERRVPRRVRRCCRNPSVARPPSSECLGIAPHRSLLCHSQSLSLQSVPNATVSILGFSPKRCACCGPWYGTRETWWRRLATGYEEC